MIQNTLDIESAPLLLPESFYGKHNKICDICIITFSHEVIRWALEHLKCRKTAEIRSINGNRPIYFAEVDGKKIAFYMTFISPGAAATCLEEARCLTGADHYIVFGSCGSLNPGVTDGKVIVPVQAYRDEGLSYHYLAPSEYIELENAGLVADFMEKSKVPYVTGKIWTTEALYRETKNKVERLKKDGCIAVEMEVAALEAVCRFYGLHLYGFLLPGDFFSGEEWSVGILGKEEELDVQVRCFNLAIALGVNGIKI